MDKQQTPTESNIPATGQEFSNDRSSEILIFAMESPNNRGQAHQTQPQIGSMIRGEMPPSLPYGIEGPPPGVGYVTAYITRECSSVYHTTDSENGTIRAPTVLISTSKRDVNDGKSNSTRERLDTPTTNKAIEETNIPSSFGSKAVIQYPPNLALIEFDIRTAKPLTHQCIHSLSLPLDAHEWCLAVLQQRWYQSIGSKLIIDAAEFQGEVVRGLEYLKSFNRCIDPENIILHRWVMDIMEEIKCHIYEPEEAARSNFDDGSWQYPSAVMPELIELLPLTLSHRREHYDKLVGMPDPVCRQSDSTSKQCLLNFEALCREIGEHMKSDLHDMYSQGELNKIKEDWLDDLESDRIQTEKEADERVNSAYYGQDEMEVDERVTTSQVGRTESAAAYTNRSSDLSGHEIDRSPPTIFNTWEPEDYEDESYIPTSIVPKRRMKKTPKAPVILSMSAALKSSKFNWDDSDENEMPDYVQESSPAKSVAPEVIAQGNAEDQGGQPSNLTHRSISAEDMQWEANFQTSDVDDIGDNRSTSTIRKLVLTSSNDLDLLEDSFNDGNPYPSPISITHSDQELSRVISNDEEALVSFGEDNSGVTMPNNARLVHDLSRISDIFTSLLSPTTEAPRVLSSSTLNLIGDLLIDELPIGSGADISRQNTATEAVSEVILETNVTNTGRTIIQRISSASSEWANRQVSYSTYNSTIIGKIRQKLLGDREQFGNPFSPSPEESPPESAPPLWLPPEPGISSRSGIQEEVSDNDDDERTLLCGCCDGFGSIWGSSIRL